MRTRHTCYYDAATMQFAVVDRTKIPEDHPVAQPVPSEAIKLLSPEEVQAVVVAASRHDLLQEAVRNDFDKEVTRTHLQLIDKLIERV